MAIVVLGIDLGKNSCSLVGLDGRGSVILRRRMRREFTTAISAMAKNPFTNTRQRTIATSNHADMRPTLPSRWHVEANVAAR